MRDRQRIQSIVSDPASTLGGVIHTYQAYDPRRFPSPFAAPPDLVSGAFEHLMMYGTVRALSEEELARAVHLDPEQIKGLGPSLDALIAMLEERKRKILQTYETQAAQKHAESAFHEQAALTRPPHHLLKAFNRAVAQQQLRELEDLWYRLGDEHSPIARDLMRLIERLGAKYEVEELDAKYEFTGLTPLTVPQAIEVKQELEMIDALLAQLREALQTARIGVIDMEALAEFAEPGDMAQLAALQQQVQDFLREEAMRQGLEQSADGYRLSPQALRLFQGHLLAQIYSELDAARHGRHTGPITGEGAVEIQRTKPYEFGDSVTHMDVPQSVINALVRQAGRQENPGTVRLTTDDIEIHHTRNNPKCATAVILDMSGSMRHGGQYINCKRMALALDGLIRREYPGDYLQFIEMHTFARLRQVSELPTLMPRPVTVGGPIVRLKADMSDPAVSEMQIPPHFTNIQRALHLARQMLSAQDTPNRQVILITDGLPTAHFEGPMLYLLYPPHSRTEEATMREAHWCSRENITINIFLLPNWGQTHEDVQFAQRLAESARGRVFFTGGSDLDRCVVWDYIKQRRTILGG